MKEDLAVATPPAEADMWIDRFAESFGERLLRSQAAREQHAGLEGHHSGKWPHAVLMAETRDDVMAAMRLCAAEKVPVVAHGAGTSLEGNVSAEAGGLCIDVSRLDRVLAIEPEDMVCRVEAGVTREQLNHELRDHGLFFPIDPGANATLGGMAATRASGTNAVRYGTMRDNVRSLEVVLADGRVVETGTKAAKSAAGYDLTGLFVGSEGTLGVITAVTLKLHPIPSGITAGTIAFATVDDAVATVIATIQCGLPVARIELLDAAQIRACNLYSGLDLPIGPMLFVEFHGSEDAVAGDVAMFRSIAEGHHGGDLTVATQAEDRNRLWKARHNAYFAAKALRPGARIWSTDVCVPISKLAESVAMTRADIQRHGVTATMVGHVGDGNYHVLFVLDPAARDEWEIASGINERMVEQAIALGGTCTGEHGIGIGKRDCLLRERGADGVGLMAAIKAAIDPAGLLNPGKIMPQA